ncbi:hypothetical protein LEP1GSC173_2257 [Leptospira interrogans str. HAI1594]|uniref:Uncharacterized protein n=1 Tax=Leptospira interrogans serogroup Icterohaemorrhagiae serovar copenhageni (strain Fiocruz L1-130) TaxID=267671 RepID=Q72SU8_LEPIC|nr:hypothetical protein LIC_11275 [Leptospira interrogans serovar Copenhageni str. Fiocruz L1-130]EKP77606.1 hypothetical protein LEP1GSC173_2257 [Leptospira interrogans str. HAI1594]
MWELPLFQNSTVKPKFVGTLTNPRRNFSKTTQICVSESAPSFMQIWAPTSSQSREENLTC